MGSFREGDVKGTTSQSSYNISQFSYLHFLLANVFIFTFLKVGGTFASSENPGQVLERSGVRQNSWVVVFLCIFVNLTPIL